MSRATEKTMAWYFDSIAKCVQRELCLNIPHNKEKIGASSRFEEIYQTEDSVTIQTAADGLGQKIEMLGLEIINLKKGRKKAEDRITKLEERSKLFITAEHYRSEFENYEQRTRGYVDNQLGSLQENLMMHQDRLSKTILNFQELVDDTKKETIWKIKDCEDLLKTRISEEKVNNMINKWSTKMQTTIDDNEQKLLSCVAKSYKEAGGKIDTLKMYSENKHADIKSIVETQNENIKKML